MPYASFLQRFSLLAISATVLFCITIFAVIYLGLSFFHPDYGLLKDGTPILPSGTKFRSEQTFIAALNCFYFSVVTFSSLGNSEIIPGDAAKVAVVIQIFASVLLIGGFVAKILSLTTSDIVWLRRTVRHSLWIDRMRAEGEEDTFGLLHFEHHNTYGVSYHGTDHKRNGDSTGGFAALLTDLEKPRSTFRVPDTHTKDYGPALVTFIFHRKGKAQFQYFEGYRIDLNSAQRRFVEGWMLNKDDVKQLDSCTDSSSRNKCIGRLINAYFPLDTNASPSLQSRSASPSETVKNDGVGG